MTISVCVIQVCVPQCTCEGQRTTFKSWFSPSTLGSGDWTWVAWLSWQVLLPTEPSGRPNLQLLILPLPSKCWDYRCEPSCLVWKKLFWVWAFYNFSKLVLSLFSLIFLPFNKPRCTLTYCPFQKNIFWCFDNGGTLESILNATLKLNYI